MTWLWVIVIVAVVGGIVGYATSGKKEDAVAGALSAGMGCGYIILQIFFAVVALWSLFKLASWLFS